MLIRLSIDMGENKVFSFDSKKTSRTLIDPQMIDGFFESARCVSPSPDQVIQKIKFFKGNSEATILKLRCRIRCTPPIFMG